MFTTGPSYGRVPSRPRAVCSLRPRWPAHVVEGMHPPCHAAEAPKLRRFERLEEAGEDGVVAVLQAAMVVVELVVFVGDAAGGEPLDELAGAVLEVVVVAGAGFEVEQAEAAQVVGIAVHGLDRVMLEPARPDLGDALAGVEVHREGDAERLGGIWGVAGGHGEDVEDFEVGAGLLDAGAEALPPGVESAGAADAAAEGGEVSGVAELEGHVAADAGDGTEDVGVARAEGEGAVATAGDTEGAAAVGSGDGAVVGVHPG